MIAKWDAFFARLSSASLSFIIVILISLVAIADYSTGSQVSFSIFYVAPVALASWYAPRKVAAVTCIAAASAWLVVDVVSLGYDNELIPVWNAAVRLGFFAITSSLLIALQQALVQQRFLAEIDGLTNVLNRRAFEGRCQYLFQLAERHRRSVCICYLDIDKFKHVNDAHGHQTGDAILKGIAEILGRLLRETDVVGRLGGDEFAIALPDTGHSGAAFIVRKILSRLRYLATRNDWPVGFSVGVVVCRPPLPTLSEAIHRADELMYAAKKSPNDEFSIEEFGSVAPGIPASIDRVNAPDRTTRTPL